MADLPGSIEDAPIGGLPPATERVFRVLATQPTLRDFVLIGGTAIALQMRHRLSEDLDFWLPHGRLSDRAIKPALDAAQLAGLPVRFTTPHHQVTNFRIMTGERLEVYARDYSVGGVKVQFFAPRDEEPAYDGFRNLIAGDDDVVTVADSSGQVVATAFRIMPLAGLFAMKSYTIQRRHRSRDVLDLWHFVKSGRSVAEIIAAGVAASSVASAERAITVLRGDLAPDADDEGFFSLTSLTIEQVRADFRIWIDAYEMERARAIKAGSKGAC